eukprot:8334-Pleurochrysis_carterae.AAC.1
MRRVRLRRSNVGCVAQRCPPRPTRWPRESSSGSDACRRCTQSEAIHDACAHAAQRTRDAAANARCHCARPRRDACCTLV